MADKKSRVFSKNDFMKLPEPKASKEWVEGLGAYVYFKSMGAGDQDSYENALIRISTDEEGNPKTEMDGRAMRAKFLVRTITDQHGNRLFNDDEYEILAKKFPRSINELFTIAQKVSGLDNETKETDAKNSESGQAEDSPSD